MPDKKPAIQEAHHAIMRLVQAHDLVVRSQYGTDIYLARRDHFDAAVDDVKAALDRAVEEGRRSGEDMILRRDGMVWAHPSEFEQAKREGAREVADRIRTAILDEPHARRGGIITVEGTRRILRLLDAALQPAEKEREEKHGPRCECPKCWADNPKP